MQDRLIAALGPMLAGGLIALSMPPWGWWPLAFVGIAIFDQLLAGQPRRTRAARGFATGLWWWFPASAWMVAFTLPGWLIFGLLSSVFLAIVAALVPATAGRRLMLVALMIAVAWLQWRFPFGGVPLASLAISQAEGPLGQFARIFGSLTIVGLTATIGVGLSAAADRQWRGVAGAAAGVAAGLVLFGVAPGAESVGSMDIAIVQGGGPQGTRAINTSARDVFDRHVDATRLLSEPVDLVVWPENVVTVRGPLEERPEFDELVALAREVDAPIVVGLIEQFDEHFLNASEIITPDGEILSRYDKVLRVPYGEYVPFRSLIEWAAPAALPSRDAIAGTEPAVLTFGDITLGVSISWEIFFERRGRDAISNGGEVLLNPTNGSSYSFTIVQTQQIASSQLRAHETDRWVAQAAPTGFSAFISPDGDVIDRTSVSEQAVITATVDRRVGETWATSLGDWPMMLIAAALAGAAVTASHRSDEVAR